MTTFAIDPNYGYVLLAATSTLFLGVAHSINTGNYRKAAKVDYPAAYAPASRTDAEADRFNCAQRAHVNYLENQTQFLPALLIAGTRFPLISAAFGAFWTASRFMYMVGYSKGGPGGKGRYKNGGVAFWLSQFALLGLAAYNGVALAMGW